MIDYFTNSYHLLEYLLTSIYTYSGYFISYFESIRSY